MTVKDLIEELSKLPQDLPIYKTWWESNDEGSGFEMDDEIESVNIRKDFLRYHNHPREDIVAL